MSADANNPMEDTFDDFYYDGLVFSDNEENSSVENEENDSIDTNEYVQKEVFSNYVLHSKDGKFLGYLTKQRLRWHMRKNKYISIDHDKKILVVDQLLKEVQEKTNNSVRQHYSVKKENLCVSCGSEYDLVRLRIIPHCITKLFPEESKTGAENIVAICVDCNTPMTKKLENYKLQLYKTFSVDLVETAEREKLLMNYRTAIEYVKNPELFDKKSKIKFKKVLDAKLKHEYNKHFVTDDDIKKFINETENKYTQLELHACEDVTNSTLMSKVVNLSEFKKGWIKFFFDNIEVNHMTDEVKRYLDGY